MSDKIEKAFWLDTMTVSPRTDSICPSPLDELPVGRAKCVRGNALDLTQFSVNLVTLEHGARFSHRHRHNYGKPSP